MAKKTDIRKEKKVMLSDKELIEKYEAGEQPMSKMISVLLSKAAPNAPTKVQKRNT